MPTALRARRQPSSPCDSSSLSDLPLGLSRVDLLSASGMPFRILSVDGGGIRGLIPALLLQDLEARLRKQRPNATLTDHFDLFVGTSTGGLIVLGLTAPAE